MVGQEAEIYSFEEKKYPAYCVYIPTGMDEEFEKPILDKLMMWGKNMGKNLYVAPLDIGDPSYIGLMDRIGFKNRPAIILSDTDVINLRNDSFMLTLDDPQLMRDLPKMIEILPALLDLILKRDYMDATKAAIQARKIEKLKSISKDIELVLDKVKINFSWNGVGVESK
jgi:hypothetical protein